MSDPLPGKISMGAIEAEAITDGAHGGGLVLARVNAGHNNPALLYEMCRRYNAFSYLLAACKSLMEGGECSCDLMVTQEQRQAGSLCPMCVGHAAIAQAEGRPA